MARRGLGGLIFAAISSNLEDILETPGLDRRALEAVSLLIGGLLLSLLALIPQQPAGLFAGEAGLIGVILAVLTVPRTVPLRRILPAIHSPSS